MPAKKKSCYILKCVFCLCGFYMIISNGINKKYEQKAIILPILSITPLTNRSIKIRQR